MKINIKWFKCEIAPMLKDFEIEYDNFEKGDFGDLERVEFNNDKRGGEVDFWSSGYIGIHSMDYQSGEVLLNILFEPEKDKEVEQTLRSLIELLLK
jgi:hypothetical protein